VRSLSPRIARDPGGIGPWEALRRLGSTAESRLVGLTAFAMGMALVTFPAASGVIMGSRDFALSGAQYGDLVLPEVVAAILAALTGFGLRRRRPTRLAYRIGVSLSLLSMILLLATAPVEASQSVTFPILLAGGALLGAGFGFTVPVLMAYARFLHATDEDPSLLVLNGLLAVGAILAPAIALGFAQIGWWWGLPVVVGAMHVVQLSLSGKLPAHAGASPGPPAHSRKRTVRFLSYAVFAMVYATSAAIIVIWCQLKVASRPSTVVPAQLTAAIRVGGDPLNLRTSLVLAALWGGLLVLGRVIYAAADRWLAGPWRLACYLTPLVVFGALVAAGVISSHRELAVIAVFGLAVAGCAALLPLRMSFHHLDVVAITAALAGGMVAYQLAYGFMVDGARPSPGPGPNVGLFFALASLVGVVMATLAIAAIRHRPAGRAAATAPGRASSLGDLATDRTAGTAARRRAAGRRSQSSRRRSGQPAAARCGPVPLHVSHCLLKRLVDVLWVDVQRL
jgi:MFS family permease